MQSPPEGKKNVGNQADRSSRWPGKSRSMMKWATDGTTRRAVYIGSLARQQTGLQCGCVCPECGGQLQAVNAGVVTEHRPDSRSLEPHFRHDSGEQKQGCKISAAERAALQLLIEHDEIEIPAPTAHRTILGVSGTLYEWTATGVALRAVILQRRVLDETAAILTLEDGREVLICLEGSRAVDQHGQLSAVITINVDDPEAALWSPEEILTKARLPGGWMCLRRHWQDNELGEQAQSNAVQKADDQIDIDTEDVDLPSGLTTKQRSECLLHWKIKSLLTEAKFLITPAVNIEVPYQLPNGQFRAEWVRFPELDLELTEVAYEVPMDGFKPDIACMATDPTGTLGTFRLIIEVAVTHRVDAIKLRKIATRKIACLELDTNLIAHQGRISVENLRSLVLTDPSWKEWLYHEVIENKVNETTGSLQRYVSQMAAAIKQTEARRQKQLELQAKKATALQEETNRKQQWFRQLSDEQVAQEYLVALRREWNQKNMMTSNHMVWTADEWKRLLTERKMSLLTQDAMCRMYGVLHLLSAIRRASRDENKPLPYIEFRSKVKDERWKGLLMSAISIYRPFMKDGIEIFEHDYSIVEASIMNGATDYVRPSEYDRVIALVFPELADELGKEKGTRIYAENIRQKLAEEEAAMRITQAEVFSAAERKRAAAEAEIARINGLAEAVRSLVYQFEWQPFDKKPANLEEAINFSKRLGCSGESTVQIIESAWAAREQGRSFSDWLTSQAPQSEKDVEKLGKATESSWIVSKKNASPVVVQRKRK